MAMKKWLGIVIFVIINAIWIAVTIKINYPPSQEQLSILNLIKFEGGAGLWSLRATSLTGLILTLTIFFKITKSLTDEKTAGWSIFLLSISPIFWYLWSVHPIFVFKLLILSLIIWTNYSLKKRNYAGWFILLSLTVCLINFFLIGNRPAILNKFSLKDAQSEVTARITEEDTLKEKIILPLWWRRIAYNKYYFTYKEIVAEVIPYFDLESIYFQELNPNAQKSMVMFYWPEIYLLLLGLYFLVREKNKEISGFLILMSGVSLVNFVFSEGESDLRLILVMIPLSVVMAKAIDKLLELGKKKYWLARWTVIILIALCVYGLEVNSYDLEKRPEYWLDNRPLTYQFWYERMKNLDLNKIKNIDVTSLIGNSKAYCLFYLGDQCNESKFVFNSFNLLTEKAQPNSLYAGFSGEFVGPKFKNDIDLNWEKIATARGLTFIETKSLFDTIAYQYGNDIGLAIQK